MELMQYKYNDDAGKNGVYIISACGFDSVPNDLGVVHFMKIFDGNLLLYYVICCFVYINCKKQIITV